MSKEAYHMAKETCYMHKRKPYRYAGIPEVCVSVKRTLFIWQKRPVTVTTLHYYYTAKEPYAYRAGKGGLCIPQKSPMHTAKEACVYGKRALFIRQRRPVYTAKEACAYGKGGELALAYR